VAARELLSPGFIALFVQMFEVLFSGVLYVFPQPFPLVFERSYVFSLEIRNLILYILIEKIIKSNDICFHVVFFLSLSTVQGVGSHQV